MNLGQTDMHDLEREYGVSLRKEDICIVWSAHKMTFDGEQMHASFAGADQECRGSVLNYI